MLGYYADYFAQTISDRVYACVCVTEILNLVRFDQQINSIKIANMGRKENKKVSLFFKYDKAIDKSTCNVCGTKLTGKHATNLKRHLTTKHSETFEDLDTTESSVKLAPKKRKITIETNEDEITSSLVKIVTTCGGPFLLLDNEGFRDIVNPIYDALSMDPITSRNIMCHVNQKERSIRHDIKCLTKGKLISLKIDVATRMDKAISVVNLQMINSTMQKSEVIIKTLGLIQMFESHSGRYIKERLTSILQEYEIEMENVFSITSDNGNNMVKAIEIFNDDDEATDKSLVDDDWISDDAMRKLDSINLSGVHLVRCAAHTLHLCVYDVNQQSEISENINICRNLCIALRKGTHRRTLIEHNKNIPTLDVATNWISTFTMLKRLLELKEFLAAESFPTKTIDWVWIELYINAFQDAYDATIRLQHEQLVYSNFFILWMELSLKCEKSTNYMAKMLFDQMKAREAKLLENETLLAAIYMDPRVNIVLSNNQKMLAKQNLKQIAFRIYQQKQVRSASHIKEEKTLSKSLLDAYLDEVQTASQVEAKPICDKLMKIYIDIENFDIANGRLPLDANIFQFYEGFKFKTPHLAELAHVVQATPATQVSLERAFSALHLILNEKRSSLSAEDINSLLIVKLNSE